MVQTYKKSLTKYALGRRVNMEEWNACTGVAAAQIPFGAPVEAGPLGGQQVKEWDGTGVVLGITEASVVLPHPGDYFSQYDNLAYGDVCVIGVLAGSNVTKGAPAYYDFVAHNWVAADGANANVVLGATFDADGASGEIVPVRYRRPNGVVVAA